MTLYLIRQGATRKAGAYYCGHAQGCSRWSSWVHRWWLPSQGQAKRYTSFDSATRRARELGGRVVRLRAAKAFAGRRAA